MKNQKKIFRSDENVLQKDQNTVDLLIISYLTGDIDQAGLERLSQWMGESKEHTDYVNQMKASWILSGSGRKPADTDTSWKELSYKITEDRKPSGYRITWQKMIQVAAAFLLVFSMGAVTMYLLQHQETEGIAYLPAETVVEAPLGSISKVTLPDSSQVWLNAGSMIRYQNDFGLQARKLELTGEAYFSVKTNPQKPFMVKANNVTVQALGTKFNVKAYPEDIDVTATLEEGIIDINIDHVKHEDIRLKPKEKIVIRKHTYEMIGIEPVKQADVSVPDAKTEAHVKEDIRIVSGINVSQATSWKDRQWQINDESLVTFVPVLARRYNQNMIIRDAELNQYKFTGTIVNESIEHILEALRQTAPLDYAVYKDSIVLTINYANKAKFAPILKNKN